MSETGYYTDAYTTTTNITKDLVRYRDSYPDKDKGVISSIQEVLIIFAALCATVFLLMAASEAGKFAALSIIVANLWCAHWLYTKSSQKWYDRIKSAALSHQSKKQGVNESESLDILLKTIVIGEKQMNDAIATINNAYMCSIGIVILPLALSTLIGDDPAMKLLAFLGAVGFIAGCFYTSLRLLIISRD